MDVPDDMLQYIALKLDLKSLDRLCTVNKRCQRVLGRNNYFWKSKYDEYASEAPPNADYKKLFRAVDTAIKRDGLHYAAVQYQLDKVEWIHDMREAFASIIIDTWVNHTWYNRVSMELTPENVAYINRTIAIANTATWTISRAACELLLQDARFAPAHAMLQQIHTLYLDDMDNYVYMHDDLQLVYRLDAARIFNKYFDDGDLRTTYVKVFANKARRILATLPPLALYPTELDADFLLTTNSDLRAYIAQHLLAPETFFDVDDYEQLYAMVLTIYPYVAARIPYQYLLDYLHAYDYDEFKLINMLVQAELLSDNRTVRLLLAYYQRYRTASVGPMFTQLPSANMGQRYMVYVMYLYEHGLLSKLIYAKEFDKTQRSLQITGFKYGSFTITATKMPVMITLLPRTTVIRDERVNGILEIGQSVEIKTLEYILGHMIGYYLKR